MLKESASGHSLQDDFEWAARSEHWRAAKPVGRRGPAKKYKYREPLVLCGHGVRVRVDHTSCISRVYVGNKMSVNRRKKLLSQLESLEIGHKMMVIDGYAISFKSPTRKKKSR